MPVEFKKTKLPDDLLTIEIFFMKRILFSILSVSLAASATAQLKIDNATFFIQPGATVTVQGDVTSNVDIQGTGLLLLKGSIGKPFAGTCPVKRKWVTKCGHGRIYHS